MMPFGTCPKCGTLVATLNFKGVNVNAGAGSSWQGVTYNCPMCSVVLGAGIDPVALKSDTVDEILQALGKC